MYVDREKEREGERDEERDKERLWIKPWIKFVIKFKFVPFYEIYGKSKFQSWINWFQLWLIKYIVW